MATRRRLSAGRLVTKKAATLEGIPEVVARANKLMAATGYRNHEVAAELKHGLMKAGLIVRDEARDNIHHIDHVLEQAVFAAYGDPQKADILIGVNPRRAVDPDSDDRRTYAGIVEYGDDTRAPHPYLRPAVNSTRPLVARIVKEEITQAVETLTNKIR